MEMALFKGWEIVVIEQLSLLNICADKCLGILLLD